MHTVSLHMTSHMHAGPRAKRPKKAASFEQVTKTSDEESEELEMEVVSSYACIIFRNATFIMHVYICRNK